MKILAFAAIAALAAAGCGTSLPLETFTLPPGFSPGGVLVSGVLGGNAKCAELLREGEPAVALLWQDAYSATFPPLQIFDHSGMLVASASQQIWLGVDTNRTTANKNCSTTRAYWVYSISTRDPVGAGP